MQLVLEVYIWSWRNSSWCRRYIIGNGGVGGKYSELVVCNWCWRYIFGNGGITVGVGEMYLELEVYIWSWRY